MRQWWHFGLDTLSAMDKSRNVFGLPIHVTIEPTNVCNLHCPVCETGAGVLRRPKGFLALSEFTKILDKIGNQVNELMLYFMGEPFLNKEAYAMITEARRRGVYVSVCTNGEFVDGHRLVESGINEVSFQLGGMTQKTHETYRIGADLQKVVENMREAVQSRDYDHHKVNLSTGFIVMKHNEHEVGQFWQYCADIKVKGQLIYPCVRTVEQGEQFLPTDKRFWVYDEKAFEKGLLRPKIVPRNRCWWIYYSTVITWNGDVVPCCRDVHGDYVMGNILNQALSEIWNGGKYREFRRTISHNQSDVNLCRLCSGYVPPLPLRLNR